MMDRCLSPPMGWPPDALEPSRMPWSWRTVAEVTSSFLPALTLAAWSIKINVTAAISVESHRHLFVFHLVVHLCISMMRWAPAAVHKPGDFWFKKNKNRSLPQIQHKKKVCLYYSAMCESLSLTAGLGPSDPLPLKPGSQTDGEGLSWKKKKRKSTRIPESCAPRGGWTKRRNAEPEPSGGYWNWKILRSSNHQPGKLCRDPPPWWSITPSQSSLITGHRAGSQKHSNNMFLYILHENITNIRNMPKFPF